MFCSRARKREDALVAFVTALSTALLKETPIMAIDTAPLSKLLDDILAAVGTEGDAVTALVRDILALRADATGPDLQKQIEALQVKAGDALTKIQAQIAGIAAVEPAPVSAPAATAPAAPVQEAATFTAAEQAPAVNAGG